MSPTTRTPLTMRVRVAVRQALRDIHQKAGEDQRLSPLALVALSGGADSLALAAAAAAEARATGMRVGAVVVDHGLQDASAEVAATAARQAYDLGLAPVLVRRVSVDSARASVSGGLEASARRARYEALAEAAISSGAGWVFTAHTRDDQAEQVLLALVRGSGTRSISGIPAERQLRETVWLVRPLLDERFEINRQTTEGSCAELGLEPWHDPHNLDAAFTRVRVRERVLPALESELGPGIAVNLARSADLAREDADALDGLALQLAAVILVENQQEDEVTVAVDSLAPLPDALRNRVIRRIGQDRFASQLTREHTRAIASLVTDWKGQGPMHAPGILVSRAGDRLVFRTR